MPVVKAPPFLPPGGLRLPSPPPPIPMMPAGPQAQGGQFVPTGQLPFGYQAPPPVQQAFPGLQSPHPGLPQSYSALSQSFQGLPQPYQGLQQSFPGLTPGAGLAPVGNWTLNLLPPGAPMA